MDQLAQLVATNEYACPVCVNEGGRGMITLADFDFADQTIRVTGTCEHVNMISEMLGRDDEGTSPALQFLMGQVMERVRIRKHLVEV